MKEKKYYVYIYLDPRKPGNFVYENFCFSYEPFYVGKGTKNRAYNHLKENENNTDNKLRFIKIKKILSKGEIPIILKVKENIFEIEAYNLEKKLIMLIGRKTFKEGTLTNICPGGENPPKFYDLPLVQQEQIREKFRNKKYSKETIEKRRIKNLGKKRTEEFKTNLSESRKGIGNPMFGKNLSDEHKCKIAKKLLNNSNSKKVGQYDLENSFIKEWSSCHEVERTLGFNFSYVAKACREGKKYHDFIWRYLI